MSKSALLIGCNYTNSPSPLKGCINDVLSIQNLLTTKYGFKESEITIMRDDIDPSNTLYPSFTNLVTVLNKWVKDSDTCDVLYFHYSGHGSQVKDTNRDEKDGFDEFLVPADFFTQMKIITDDNLYNLLRNIKDTTPVYMSFDCCQSGTMCDLPYSYYYNTARRSFLTVNETKRTELNNKNIYILSAVKDNQFALDIQSNTKPQGAFTMALTACLENLGYTSVPLNVLISSIFTYLISKKYQGMSPVISCCNNKNSVTTKFLSFTPSQPPVVNPNVQIITDYLKSHLNNGNVNKTELQNIVNGL